VISWSALDLDHHCPRVAPALVSVSSDCICRKCVLGPRYGKRAVWETILTRVNIKVPVECPPRGHAVYTPCLWQDFASHITLLFTTAMLLLRHPTKATPNSNPPPLTGRSISGRRSLNPVTRQHPFRRQMVETESFASEISSRETLPVSPRPASFPPSPPGTSGPRRRQTPHDTQETLWSPTFEEYAPSQSSRIMPIPTPSVSRASGLPLPVRFRQPAPGGGVGGFASIPSPHHKSSYDNFRHNTHRLDLKFATHSDSNSPRFEIPGISEGSQEFYERRLNKWSIELDTLLIFVSMMIKGGQ